MKSRIKKLNGTVRQIEVEMPKEMYDDVFEEVLREVSRTAKIPGFRPGKAPFDMVMKRHGEEVHDEVKQRLIPKGYEQAVRENDLNPASYPDISDIALSDRGVLTFRATLDVQPEVTVKSYKGIKLTVEKSSVEDKEIDETIERMRNMHADYQDVKRAVKKGDFAICDVETYMNGELISAKRENMWIEADKEVSLLGMGEELCGMVKGDCREVDVTLPENYPDKKYAGKKALFKVCLKEVKEKKVPEIDDDLAQKFGKQDMTEVRDEIGKQLLERKQMNSRTKAKNEIMKYLLSRNKFDVPGSMVQRQLKVLLEKAENELLSKGLDKETIESHKEKLKEKLLGEAEDKVRLYFILEEIARMEEVAVTTEEVDDWLRNLAASYNQEFEKVKQYYADNDLMAGLREQLREDKTLELLFSESKVTEK